MQKRYWKIITYKNLPFWAASDLKKEKRSLFITIKYPGVNRQSVCPLTLMNLIRTLRETHRYKRNVILKNKKENN